MERRDTMILLLDTRVWKIPSLSVVGKPILFIYFYLILTVLKRIIAIGTGHGSTPLTRSTPAHSALTAGSVAPSSAIHMPLTIW